MHPIVPIALLAALCAGACESSPAARPVGLANAPRSDTLYWNNYARHEQALRGRADTIARDDPRTVAAYNDFRNALGPEGRVWWDSIEHAHGPTGVAFGDSRVDTAFRRYRRIQSIARVRALDSLRFAEGQRTFLVDLAVVDATRFPDAGRLYRRPGFVDHDVLVLRRDQLTPERVRSAIGFLRATWRTSGLTPASDVALDIPSTPDLDANSGVSQAYAERLVQLRPTWSRRVSLDSLGTLTFEQVIIPLPESVRRTAPAE